MAEDIQFPPGTPDEVQAFYRAQWEKRQMVEQEAMASIYRLFMDSDDDTLAVLSNIFTAIAQGGGEGLGAFYSGLTASEVYRRSQLEAERALLEAPADEGEPVTSSTEAFIKDQMASYNVSSVDLDGRPLEGSKVRCLGCGTIYVSLDDRMRRRPGPEGCEQCIDKAKWG